MSAGLLLCLNPAYAKNDASFASERTRNTLVELYTSDASADCNPALQWMVSLRQNQKDAGLWEKVIPIAFHVPLWNIAGYKDAFGKKEFDSRILEYKKKWSVSNVYCPTMIVNGVEWSGWARSQPIPVPVDKNNGVLLADGSKKEDVYEITFKPSKEFEGETFIVYGAMVAFGLKTTPSEGKNRGKVLNQDFTCLLFRSKDFHLSYGDWVSTLELSRPKGLRAQKLGVVFWVTRTNDVRPVQVVGGYLPT